MLKDGLVEHFRVTDGDDFRLKRFDPADTGGLDLDKGEARELLQNGVKRLRDLQERLFAEKRWSVLIILQAIDTAGKDGTIEHVMSGVNPQGCEVTSFKAPSSLELRHDFLWRTTCALPERGEIGIFNRSYYEEVLVVRVHEELLAKQGLAPDLIGKNIWRERFESIRDFEKHLARNGTVILKFFLNLSKDEQRRRFLARIDEPDKNWKFEPGDLAERKHWDSYQRFYEDAIANTATEHAPWHVVPADNKWFTRLLVAATIVDRLEQLDPQFPTVDAEARKALAKARKELLAEDDKHKG
ncbi:polyphosphate kinase 2 family protein [Bosea sp. LjRoot90]|uniref:polyphosphate kinase 2 family protein n=1 Tax=Bosea sp. LjRoot90 TaxID=3342342 RepID=UPI003ECCC77B